MGTRHLTEVDINGEVKIAQYGQWDGYIDGQGYNILNFLRDKDNIEKLKTKIKQISFLTDEKNKEFLDDYNKNVEGKDVRTPEQLEWFATYQSRDIGSDILYNIINSEDNKNIILNNQADFKEDKIMCEFYYIINLDNMTLNINDYKIYDINNLPSNEDVLKDFTESDDE